MTELIFSPDLFEQGKINAFDGVRLIGSYKPVEYGYECRSFKGSGLFTSVVQVRKYFERVALLAPPVVRTVVISSQINLF